MEEIIFSQRDGIRGPISVSLYDQALNGASVPRVGDYCEATDGITNVYGKVRSVEWYFSKSNRGRPVVRVFLEDRPVKLPRV